MLSFFKKGNRFYELTVPITRGAACTLPLSINPDLIVCYVAAANEEAARDITLKKLELARCTIRAGWRVLEVDPTKWSTYIVTRWPRTHQNLPKKDEVDALVKRGGLFFGAV